MDRAKGCVLCSNFELLRIVSMVLIIAHRYTLHSGFSFDTASISLRRFLSFGGKIGVNLFVLISGYFLLNSAFRSKRITLL